MRKRTRDKSQGCLLPNQRSFKLANLAMGSLGHTRDTGEDLRDQEATGAVADRDRVGLPQTYALERRKQVISVASRVSISRRIHRYRVALRERSERLLETASTLGRGVGA